MGEHGLLGTLLATASPTSVAFSLLTFSLIYLVIYFTFLDPLKDVPGPWHCRLTALWTYYHSYLGDECTLIDALHKKYGPVVRIAPNEVIFADGAALAPIYTEKGGFAKAPCYQNFDLDGHATIFSTRDSTYRSQRSKAVLPLFSTTSIRNGSDRVEMCIDRMIDRLRREAQRSRGSGKPVNVLNLSRSLALDAVSSYLFGREYGGVDEEEMDRMSASGFVDALVAFGRFFYLPNWLFLLLEVGQRKLLPEAAESESTATVEKFSQALVNEASKEDDNTYQGRLLRAGITTHETGIQVNDLIFAGTDSTGTNFATILWNLAKHPETYQALRAEVAAADAQDPVPSPQSLPYLDAVVREGLRLSMANPARLPRVVPRSGFEFTTTQPAPSSSSSSSEQRTYRFPADTLVGLQPYTLHHNPAVFPAPHTFAPSRWLEAPGGPTPEMQRDWIPFGLGQRQCIARNLALSELFLATRAVARSGVLEGARAVGDRIEILEWFNSHVVGDCVGLAWD